MPNMCYNNLVIKGNRTALKEFSRFAEGDGWSGENKNPLDFNRFIPMPEKIARRDYFPDGYNWEVDNWGVKWGACDAVVNFSGKDKSLHYSFETPWNIPFPAYEKMSEMFPNLVFEIDYGDTAMGWGGLVVFERGEKTKLEEFDLQDDDE